MRREGDGGSAYVPPVGLLHLLRQAVVVVSVPQPVVVSVVPHPVVVLVFPNETVGPFLQAVPGVAPSHLAQDSPQTAWLRCNWLPVVRCPITLFWLSTYCHY